MNSLNSRNARSPQLSCMTEATSNVLKSLGCGQKPHRPVFRLWVTGVGHAAVNQCWVFQGTRSFLWQAVLYRGLGFAPGKRYRHISEDRLLVEHLILSRWTEAGAQIHSWGDWWVWAASGRSRRHLGGPLAPSESPLHCYCKQQWDISFTSTGVHILLLLKQWILAVF